MKPPCGTYPLWVLTSLCVGLPLCKMGMTIVPTCTAGVARAWPAGLTWGRRATAVLPFVSCSGPLLRLGLSCFLEVRLPNFSRTQVWETSLISW